jgi:predicted transcriptional regulator
MVADTLVIPEDDGKDRMTADSSLLPTREPVETDVDGQFVSLDDAGSVIDALASGTSRSIMSTLYESPRTASDVAEAVDTSMQNADYHLNKLRDAGLVEVVDTWYSSKGTEMDVYAPASDPLVMFVGRTDTEAPVSDLVDDAGRPAQPSD